MGEPGERPQSGVQPLINRAELGAQGSSRRDRDRPHHPVEAQCSSPLSAAPGAPPSLSAWFACRVHERVWQGSFWLVWAWAPPTFGRPFVCHSAPPITGWLLDDPPQGGGRSRNLARSGAGTVTARLVRVLPVLLCFLVHSSSLAVPASLRHRPAPAYLGPNRQVRPRPDQIWRGFDPTGHLRVQTRGVSVSDVLSLTTG